MKSKSLILTCCFFLLFAPGCADTIEWMIYGDHTFSEPFEQPFDDIWDVLVDVMERNYELEKLSKADSKVVSKWDETFAPIRGHGFRIRVDAVIKEEEGLYLVGVRAIMDKNDDIERPLEKDEAEWEYAGREPVIEQKVLQQVRFYLQKEFGPSEQLKQELEMEEDRRLQDRLREYRKY